MEWVEVFSVVVESLTVAGPRRGYKSYTLCMNVPTQSILTWERRALTRRD